MTKEPIKAKITLIGEGNTGKSCLLYRYILKEYNTSDYVPTIFENKTYNLKYKNRVVELDLWDTAGQQDYSRMMPLSFPSSDLLLITFSIDDPDTFALIMSKWVAEVSFHCRDVPFILVGNKADLRYDPDVIERLVKIGKSPVSEDAGLEMQKRIGAIGYFECSAKDGGGVEELFEAIVRKVYKDYRRRNRCKFFKNLWQNIKDMFE